MTTVSEQHPAREPDDYGPGVRAALAEHRIEPDRRILDVADAYREALAEYLWREMSTGDSAEWIPFDEGEYEADGREESERIIAAIRTDGATVDPAEMTGPAYSVEHALPPISDADYHPLPVRRSELVQQLDARRDNDVYVYVPIDGRAPARLGIARVGYLHERDQIALYTSPWYLGIEQDGPAYTPWVTLSGRDIEHLLCDHSGVVVQAQDTADEETAHPLSVGECDGDGCDADLPDECEGQCAHCPDEGPPRCVLLLSSAFPAGVLHLPSGERTAVRIEVAA